MLGTQIVGIMLVKDEDLFIESAVRNVVGFCDLFLIADNESQDKTYPILSALAEEFPNIRLRRIALVAESHRMIENYANTNTWIFGVDGDEIYDPAGLATLRKDLLAGRYDEYWHIFGNVLHCRDLNETRTTARGYLTPPALSMTKLYNFAKISEWRDCPQRLHWGKKTYNEPTYQNLELFAQTSWNDSVFRCLHTVFLPRSSMQKTASLRKTRYNPSELKRNSMLDWSLGYRHVLKQIFIYPITRIPWFDYKHRVYGKGPVQTVSATPFFPSRTSLDKP